MNPLDQQPSEVRRRSVLSFVVRGGRMTAGQQRAWDRHWPEFGRDIRELPAGPLNIADWFGRSAPVILEIGSGMGETTAALAAAQSDVNYLAVEVYPPGLAQLLMRAEEQEIHNLRLLQGDALKLLAEHLEPDSLAEIRVYFPDPWPKKRHHKRRIIQPKTVALMTSRLQPGGVLHLATDWADYAEQMLEVCSTQPALRNLADTADGFFPRPDWRPVTKFEKRAQEEGRGIADLRFERV